MEVILASQSPRRRELMQHLHIPFVVRVADIDETMDPAKPPIHEVARVSRRKAEAIPRNPEDIVIAADTIVVCDGLVLGKPADEEDAFRMLSMLSGRNHQVMTGLAVCLGEKVTVATEVTNVHFRALSTEEIWDYIATGEPMDKAGAYGIQGGASVFAERIEGDFYNVIGLPICRLSCILKELMEETQ